ncbi:carbohydrate ABC transporter permease [Candidatus Bipolaricaulota bacterium]|nr:carbohydrate ABC transporter permease [Candidatus Bipolaricaulota bacterium]
MRKSKAGKILSTVVSLVVIVIWLTPVFWMIKTSLVPSTEINAAFSFIPQTLSLENYRFLFNRAPILRWLLNSFVVSISVTVGTLIVTSSAAYALSRIEFPFRNVLFYVSLAGITVPPQGIMIAQYLLLDGVNLLNSYFALILPGLASPIALFILKQFFDNIPSQLEDSAQIDGANRLRIFLYIVLPMSRPAITTAAIYTFVWTWNAYMWPLIATSTNDMYTLTVGLATFQGSYVAEYGAITASAVIASVPMILIFLIFQRHIVQGLTGITGIKG